MKKASLSSEYVYLEFQLVQGSEQKRHPSVGGRPSLWTQSEPLREEYSPFDVNFYYSVSSVKFFLPSSAMISGTCQSFETSGAACS